MTAIIPPSKTCTKCGQTKPLTEFYKHKGRKNGYTSACASCHKLYFENWRRKHPEKERARHKEYNETKARKASKKRYRRKNTRKIKDYMVEYRTENAEQITQWQLQYRTENAETIRERAKKKYYENQEHILARKHADRARRRGAPGVFTGEDWERLKEYYSYTCLKCGNKEPDIQLTIDHVIPLSQGGTNNTDNIQPLCQTCNPSKGTRAIDYRNKPNLARIGLL